MDTIPTPYGPLMGAVLEPGTLLVQRPCPLDSPLGRLLPRHADDDRRFTQHPAVTLYPDGRPKSLPLAQSHSIRTSVGEVPAELVTFHPDGGLARVFPLDGDISAYWTEADEAALAEPLLLATPAGEIRARCLSLAFYPDGALKSLGLWPGETAVVDSPLGRLSFRKGLAFYPDGALRSLEPAEAVTVMTPVGELGAYDPDPEGLVSDVNSLAFHPDGSLARVATVADRLVVAQGGRETAHEPGVGDDPCGEGEGVARAMVLAFEDGRLRVLDGAAGPLGAVGEKALGVYDLAVCAVRVERNFRAGRSLGMKLPSFDCA